MTNTFEGLPFVNAGFAAASQTTTYLANLFPDFRDTEVAQGTTQYAQVGTTVQQAVGIMGECKPSHLVHFVVLFNDHLSAIFICPTYFLLRAFKNNGFKVRDGCCDTNSVY